jgi:1,2-diacylglycerol 3-beta-glucosyltransferase
LNQTPVVILFLLAAIAYFIEYLIFARGIYRAMRTPHAATATLTRNAEPNVTVLVCARDEENNIEHCLASLIKLNYPTDKLQILIVDDKSTDRTPQILEAWQKRMTNLSVLRTGEEIGNLQGKVNALAQGMDAATGEFVMITDADSTVDPDWVKSYLSYYEGDTGMVASITLLSINSLFDGIQSIDWSYLLGMASASANIGVPLSVIGNNISIRRAAYESVGGYREIPFSITEDYALFQAIWHKAPWKVKFPIQSELTVVSAPTPDFKSWWRQKHRWVKGGQSLKAIGYLIFGIGLVGNLAMLTALFILPLWPALLVIAIKWAADLLIIMPVLARTKMERLLTYFPLYELYLALFVFSMPAMIMQKNVKWKGRVYKH